jgi:ABC-type polysaccharide transport system permease subunit
MMNQTLQSRTANPVVSIVKEEITKRYQLYLLILLPAAYIFVFRYIPMYGAIIAFKKYNIVDGILGSPWIGFDNFVRLFHAYDFPQILRNTLGISIYQLVASFPIPIVLAIAINSCGNRDFKKVVQMTTYAPYFLSMAVLVGMVQQFLSEKTGIVNHLLVLLTGQSFSFLTKPELFSTIYVWSGVWQTSGYAAIIYIAALSGIDPSLHEAATVDGATKLQRIRHIDFPGILPTVTIVLLLNLGSIMSVGFEKVFLMQNTMNLSSSEIIDTYIYRVSIGASLPDYSYATAVGMFNSVINFTLLLLSNKFAGKISGSSLF